MAILILQHEPSETLGRIAPIFRDHGHRFDIRRLDVTGGKGPRGIPPDFDGVDAVISLGGAINISDNPAWLDAELNYLREAHARQLPVLGICLGHQLIAKALGGEVAPMTSGAHEWGFHRVLQTPAGNTDTILAGIPWGTYQFQMHQQEVTRPPDGATVLQNSPACKTQCFRVGLRTYGFQYHFEVQRERLDSIAASRDRAAVAEMQKFGIAPADLARQMTEHWDAFDRLADRLTSNLASFMFPLMKKALGARA